MKKTKKTTAKLSYYILALLMTILILALWQGFRDKNPTTSPTVTPTPVKNTPSSQNQDDARVFFASNGKNTVYKIKKGDKWTVIFNGVEGKEYDFVSNPVFSADGINLAYSAEINNQSFVVVNNIQEIISYQKTGYIIFSPNGSIIAFVAIQNSTSSMIVTANVAPIGSIPTTITGNESQPYQQIGTTTNVNGETVSIIFSPDGEQIAYIVIENGGVYAVVNGEAGAIYDEISNFIFNDDGTFTYIAQNGNTTVTIVNNNEISTTPIPNTNTSAPVPNATPSPTPSHNSSTPTPINYELGDYPYKISTSKDINTSSEDQTDYKKCVGQNCNF